MTLVVRTILEIDLCHPRALYATMDTNKRYVITTVWRHINHNVRAPGVSKRKKHHEAETRSANYIY